MKYLSLMIAVILALFLGMCEKPIVPVDSSPNVRENKIFSGDISSMKGVIKNINKGDKPRTGNHFWALRIRKHYYPNSNTPYGVLWVRSNLGVYITGIDVYNHEWGVVSAIWEYITPNQDYVLHHQWPHPTIRWSSTPGPVHVVIKYKEDPNSSITYTEELLYYMS
jgi:hypothetical protein